MDSMAGSSACMYGIMALGRLQYEMNISGFQDVSIVYTVTIKAINRGFIIYYIQGLQSSFFCVVYLLPQPICPTALLIIPLVFPNTSRQQEPSG